MKNFLVTHHNLAAKQQAYSLFRNIGQLFAGLLGLLHTWIDQSMYQKIAVPYLHGIYR